MSVINFLSGLLGFEDERRGKELLHSQGGSTPFKYKNEITRQLTRSCMLPVPNDSKRRKEEKNAMIWGSEQIKRSLTCPVRILGRILELGISRGIEQCQERPIYLHTATLSAGVLVIENSTLPSSCRIKLWSCKICHK